MDDTGRQTGARRGQRPPVNGVPRPGPRRQPESTPEGAEGFEGGWFAKPGTTPAGRVDGRPGTGSSAHLPPVQRPRPRPAPGPPPAFDQEAFENGFTDPGPFGRVPFESRPAMRPVAPPAEDTDFYERLYGDEEPPTHEPEEPERDRAKQDERKKRKLPFWIELPLLVVVALVFTFLIQSFVARVYVIPSGSMELTLNGNNGTGDRILVDKVVYDFHGPRPGDVVVFKGPPGWDQTEFFANTTTNPVVGWLRNLAASVGITKPNEYDLVKRVIAVGGQTVSCCDARNRTMVDGKPLDEPYVYWQPGRPGPAKQLHFKVTVPQGYLWVEGDNRANSDDSRYQDGGGVHGVVPVGNVIGKARTIIWPPSRWQGIGDHDPQAIAHALPAARWGAETGIGALAALPTWWLGRRFRPVFREAAGLPVRRRRRRR